ncbi:ABC transporter permease [Rufibacter psychrotolerans]|uniref:ABC transporter permease n=1 Tax=Rufibacter psychrotolerans TaxID=2812556 RepID=UPI0019682B2A|nr:ABC transporter permease [Rufibacter sp. SYSU D00308]
MSLPTWSLQALKFLVTLWLTISCVFVVSRLLPNANTPLGLADADLAVYGLSDAATLERVKADYRQRRGYHLPLFYVGLGARGSGLAEQLESPGSPDYPWAEAAVLRHGLEPTRQFRTQWHAWEQQASPEERSTLRSRLLTWAQAAETGQAVASFLQESATSASKTLLASWNALLQKRAPLHYHLPVLQWHGTDNLYHTWLGKILQGDLGASTLDYQPVLSKIGEAVGLSAMLGCLGLATALLVSYLAGMHLAQHPASLFAAVGRHFLYLLDSIPAFVITLGVFGLYLLLGGALDSPYLAAPGESSPFTPSLLLGGLCVALFLVPHLTLQFYGTLVHQNSQLYYRTALAKGLSSATVLRRHALPNALIPSLTLLSEVIIGLISGVLVVEVTFSLPGLGSLLVKSILAADYPTVVGITLLLLLFRLGVTQLTDLALALADPRIKSV